jgi:hypothetical protein
MTQTPFLHRPSFYQPKTVRAISTEQALSVARAADVAALLSERFTTHGGPERALDVIQALHQTPATGHLFMTLVSFEDSCEVLAGALQDSHPSWAQAFQALSDLSESLASPRPDEGVIADLNQVAYLFLDLSKFPHAPEIWAVCHQILSRQIQTETQITAAPIETRYVFKRAA